MRISRSSPIAFAFSLLLLGSVADAASTTCATSTVCAEYINSSSGVAIHGEANTGIGIRGTSNGSTGFYGASRSGNFLFPGVEGESLNQTGDDAAGAFGLTSQTGGAAPYLGVIAYGSRYGVFGIGEGNGGTADSAPESAGVVGLDPGDNAGADTNAGVFGKTSHGTAVLALANVTNVKTYVFGNAVFGNAVFGVLGDAEPDPPYGAYGVEGISSSVPVDAFNPLSSTNSEVQLANQSYLIYAASENGSFIVDNSGNITAKSLMTSKGSYARTTGSSGTARILYAAHTTSPITEDFGEGQLVNGRGYVRLDPALADVIDNRNAYHVFLTPEGDSKGLYVTAKTPAGFVVRESSGGRSTLPFEYRILAKPVDENGARLALAPPLPHAASPMQRMRTRNASATEPVDPFARLKQKLGPAAYARALKAARLVETGP